MEVNDYGISNAEGTLNADMAAAGSNEAAQEVVKTGFVAKIQDLMSQVTRGSLVIIGIWIAVILVLSFAAVWALIHFGYKITEESHREMVDELEKRHKASGFAKDELAEEQAA